MEAAKKSAVCSTCGFKLESTGRFCPFCGARQSAEIMSFEDVELNTRHYTIIGPKGSRPLSKREMEVAKLLFDRQGAVVTRKEMLDMFWDSDMTFGNSLEVHVCHLRKKLEQTGSAAGIRTLRGVGYKLES